VTISKRARSSIAPTSICYDRVVLLPFRRDHLAERDALDEAVEREQSSREQPDDRLALAVALSDLARALGRAAEARWATAPPNDLPRKAKLWALPLRAAGGP
jgi:hypothetical protein